MENQKIDESTIEKIFDGAKKASTPEGITTPGYFYGGGYLPPRPLIPNPPLPTPGVGDGRICIQSLQNKIMGAQQAVLISDCKFDVDMLNEHVNEFFSISIVSIHEGRTISYEAAQLIEVSETSLKFDIFTTNGSFPMIPTRSVTGEQYTLSSRDLLSRDLVIQILPNIVLNNRSFF